MPSLVWLRTQTLSFFFVCWFDDDVDHDDDDDDCLFSVTLLNDGVSSYDFAMKLLEYRNGSDIVGQGKFVCCVPAFNFLRTPPLVTSQNVEVQKSVKKKIWGFSPPKCNRINRSRQNLARERRLWLYLSTPNCALIGRGGWVYQPQV